MRPSIRRSAFPTLISLVLAIAVLPVAHGTTRAAGSLTAVTIDSQPGDWVGGGQQHEFTPSNSTIDVGNPGMQDASAVVTVAGGETWFILFGSTTASFLQVGTYEDTHTYADATHPRLQVYASSHACIDQTGRFVITELERDGFDAITSLAMSFEQTCSGATATLFGEIRFNAVAGYTLLSVTPSTVDFGSGLVGDPTPTRTVTLTSLGTVGTTLGTLSLDGPAAGDFSIEAETCPTGILAPDTSCSITLTGTPGALGARSAHLTIDDDTWPGEHLAALGVAGVPPVSSVGWGAVHAGPGYSYNIGQSLARTVNGTTPYLHATYTTNRVGGTWVDDNGPYAGINYIRTSNSGTTFTTARRLNPSTQHGSRGALASSGRFLYATWVSTTRWIAYNRSAPRVIYLRRNSSHGSPSAWNAIKRLTSLSGRVDFPTVAAAGAHVYVAYTDSVTGSIKLKISHDRAATWTTRTIGSTAATSYYNGRIGLPRVAAAGNTVAVTWRSSNAGAIRARISLDAGATWSTVDSITEASTDISAVAALSGRAAVAWTDGSGANVRTWSGGVWSAPSAVVPPSGASYTHTYGPAVALQGANGVAVAWTGCVTACTTWTQSTRADLVWSESNDDAATWFEGQVIGPSGAYASRRYNDYPTIVWPSPGIRNVAWNAGTAGTVYFKIVMRSGAGILAGTTTTAKLGSRVEDAMGVARSAPTDAPAADRR